MLLAAIDFESTWTQPVNPRAARITEVGAVLYDWESKMPVEILSTLMWDDSYPQSPPELVALTGINDEMLKKRGKRPQIVLGELKNLMDQADFLVAHNAVGFDKPLYLSECDRHGVFPSKKSWIDTRIDVEYPGHIKSKKLVHLAAEHGFCNPFAHRALFDALTMLKILERYELEKVIALSQEPMVFSVARVSYEDRQQAKNFGYFWEGDSKRWMKHMKESQFVKEQDRVPFVIAKVQAPEGYYA